MKIVVCDLYVHVLDLKCLNYLIFWKKKSNKNSRREREREREEGLRSGEPPLKAFDEAKHPFKAKGGFERVLKSLKSNNPCFGCLATI